MNMIDYSIIDYINFWENSLNADSELHVNFTHWYWVEIILLAFKKHGLILIGV